MITKQQAEELKAAIDKMVDPENKADEWPKNGDICHWLSSDGFIIKVKFENGGAHPDIKLRGNIYRTREEAELADNRRLAYVELVEAIRKANDGWRPYWEGVSDKYYLFFNKGVRVGDSQFAKYLPDELYCRSYDIALDIIERLGEEKIKLAMGW